MKKSLYAIALIAMTIFLGCHEEKSPSLTLSREEVTIEAAGDTVNIPVYCNVTSKATIVYDSEDQTGWIFLLPRVLYGDGILTMIVQPYGGVLSNRSASVTVEAGGETKTIKLTQLAKESVGLSPEIINASDNGQSYTVTVACNTTWNASVNPEATSWCTLGNITGEQGENPLTVNVAALSGLGAYDIRIATITVTTGTLSATLKIYQGFGTVINGLRWADCNVGEPGRFSSEPDEPGLLYQYNSKIGYSVEGGIPAGYETGYVDNGVSTWQEQNNPCPAGWRIPTADEIDALVGNNNDKLFAWMLPAASGFNKSGIIAGILADKAMQATKTDMQGGIFLPISGYRHVETGLLTSSELVIIQSITRPGQNWDRYMYGFSANGMYKYGGGPDGSNRSALPIRCVTDVPE
ncbi:MAG: BACON domain-containing protein [Dysgonamonadaceae bacterium]|jgi:hypothetical protein|nr:BACON domain-containing protein [Dysgonamonadaceae bacterium]